RGELADARSDIFSFGVVLYEMLAGRSPFARASGAETISAILKEDPRDFASADGIPPGLDRIVRHCLEKDSERRFQSARDLVFGLEAISDLSGSAAAALVARGPGRRWPWIAGAGAVLLAVAVFLLWRGRTGRPEPTEASASNRKSIAVLPFQNLSPDPENAFFADGMTEDILTQLAKIRDLKVISRASVMRYKGTQKPIQAIALELGVATVLEGSVRRAGGRVRITGQLIDAKTDEHLWAETYDRDLKDVFAIQSEVAQRIAGALRAALSPAEKKRIEQSPTQNLAAYDLYLKGRELYNHYLKEDNEAAIGLFEKARELDPGFALAYAGLADAFAQRVQRYGSPSSLLAASLELSWKAIALDPDLAEGHKALGLVYFVEGAYRLSLEASRRAVEINPNHQPAITNVGFALWSLGNTDEALPWLRRATELDPTGLAAPVGLGGLYATLGEAAQAESWMKRALERQPGANQGHLALILFYLGERRDEDALRQVRDALSGLPNDPRVINAAGLAELITGNLGQARKFFESAFPRVRGMRIGNRVAGAGIETTLAYLHLRAGERGPADKLLDESLATDRQAEKDGNEDWSVPFDVACVHALRGEKDEAFAWLDKAIKSGWRGWPLGTRTPLLDPLRTDARFQQLESRVTELVRQARRNAGLP
ncbi:MAG TPA: tetratricopeptide repeat protein, partial [Thermoanaerobaculia bacterium]|nr:tetratricopeptide repeat protein [Thermoanaerobaculia bacterium]